MSLEDTRKHLVRVKDLKVLIKGSHGRYLVETVGDQVNILGIGDRGNQKNVKSWKKAMKDLYDIELKYTKFS